MSEFEPDPRVAGLLVAAADEAARHIRPRGADDVVRTVRARRNRTVGAAAVLVLVAILTPLAVFGLPGRPNPGPPAGNHPSASPSRPAAPDGRIPVDRLRNATLRIPAWPAGVSPNCPAGAVRFTDGTKGMINLQGEPIYADVDHDGAQETVVVVLCTVQRADYQVLALDRSGAGKIVTLGRVVGTAGRDESDVMRIWDIAAADDGQVRVDVGDYRQSPASQHQWRTYGWDGKRFTQTTGPAAFGLNTKVTDLNIAADPLTMTKQGDGSWAGTLRVTIHNSSAYYTAGDLWFSLRVGAGWSAAPDDGCRFAPGESPLTCTMPRLGDGADRVLTLRLTAPAGPLDTRCKLRAGAQNAEGHRYPDRKPAGAAATVRVLQG